MGVLMQVAHLDADGEQQRADRIVQRALHALALGGHGVRAGGFGDSREAQRRPGVLGDDLQGTDGVVAELGGLAHGRICDGDRPRLVAAAADDRDRDHRREPFTPHLRVELVGDRR
jgi:hypothetical protein